MAGDYYSSTVARRSLLHFAAGRVVSAALSISFVLLILRGMEPAEYGAYVALIAMAEIFYVATGLGLSTIAQRYVAEYRVRAVAHDFSDFLRVALRRRLAQSLFFALVVSVIWDPLMRLSGLALADEWRPVVVTLLVASAGAAFLDEVMSALLLQGYSQALGVARNSFKLSIVATIALAGMAMSLQSLVYVEATAALLTWLSGEVLVRRWLRRAPSSGQAQHGFASASMWRVAIRFYAVQLIWTGYGQNMVKLIVTRMLGLAQTAALGAAQALTDMLRNYMPAHLLSGWIRPLLVARYVAKRDLDELSLAINLIFKLNLLGMVPAAAVFAVVGDPLMNWVTNSRYGDLGLLLTLLTGLVILQSAHVLMSMVMLTLEQPAVSLQATFAAAATLPLLVIALLVLGLLGAAIGLALGEAVWVGVTWMLLRRRGFVLRFDARGTSKIAAAGLVAAAVGTLCMRTSLGLQWWATFLVMVPTYCATALALRPASIGEIAMARRLFAARSRQQ